MVGFVSGIVYAVAKIRQSGGGAGAGAGGSSASKSGSLLPTSSGGATVSASSQSMRDGLKS